MSSRDLAAGGLLVVLAWRLLGSAGGSGAFSPAPSPPSSLVALFNGGYTGSDYAIGAARSTDGGATWTTDPGNPVLTVGSGGSWDDATVKDPWLMHDGSQFVTYYAGFDGTNYRIGRATAAAINGPWTKYGSNPVLSIGGGGSFDETTVAYPIVLHEPADTGREWKMWYNAVDGSDVITAGYAYSSDGLSWTKHGKVLDVGTAGSWYDEGISVNAIHKVGSTYYLFIAGRQGTTNPRWQVGLTTFTDPEGTYTMDAGNPVILARFNDVGCSQLLTANRAAGGTTVTVADTSFWNEGEAMILADGDSESEAHAIASIDSGTQITLARNAASAFTTAAGATIRPLAYNAIGLRSIVTSGDAFHAYGTALQSLQDLSPGGSKLREGSMRWTAPALTGPWAYDYAAGLLFPLYPANTGWDKFSAENPSVIVAP